MKLYRVGLTQAVYEGCTVEVYADDVIQATDLAIKQAKAGDNVDWDYIGVSGNLEVASVDVIKEAPDAQP